MARLTRRSRRKMYLIAVLAVLLALLTAWFINYRATKRLGFDIAARPTDAIPAPQFLYSFSGSDQLRLQRPLGVLAEGGFVYATDSRAGTVFKFTEAGRLVTTFGKGKLVTPLYIAKNPVTRNLYVSDRRKKRVEIFTADGKYIGQFDPKMPKSEMPKFDTKGTQWAPVALAFAPDGSLYVTDLLNGHRLLLFGPDGKFKRAVGTVGVAKTAGDAPSIFQFPNGVKVHGKEVFVADSNNRRVQVFNRNGDFLRIIPTSGLPRGFDFLPRRSNQSTDSPDRFVVVDTLAHDATIWTVKGNKLVSFGGMGVLEGLFSYPNDLSIGGRSIMFIADTVNGRIQAWGWPEQAAPIPLPRTLAQWMWCLSPLLLLPLLLLLRRKQFFATPEFVIGMIDAELAHTMPYRRRRWTVTPEAYEQLKDLSQGEILMAELLEPVEYSESDTEALMEKLEIGHETAVTLVCAQRAKVFCADDVDIRRLAKLLEIEVYNQEQFLQRFAKVPATGPEAPPAG